MKPKEEAKHIAKSKAKRLVLFLVLPLTGFGQQLWQGTRSGMSKLELQALFGARLKTATQDPSVPYILREPETICGADFEVYFIFDGDRLTEVRLDSDYLGDPGIGIGQCVLKRFTTKYGRSYWVLKSPAK